MYAWDQLRLAYKRICKKVQQPTAQPEIVAATNDEEQEEGELEEGECMPVDDNVDERDEVNHQAASEDKNNSEAAAGQRRSNSQRQDPPSVEMHVLESQQIADEALSLRQILAGAYVQEYPTLYIALPLIN